MYTAEEIKKSILAAVTSMKEEYAERVTDSRNSKVKEGHLISVNLYEEVEKVASCLPLEYISQTQLVLQDNKKAPSSAKTVRALKNNIIG